MPTDDANPQPFPKLYDPDPEARPRGEGARQRVAVPDDLREFLSYVHDCIVQEDDGATVPSDDLLQSESAYGGLDAGGQTFSFVYFPGPDTSERWEFSLTPSEVEQLGPDGGAELTVRRFRRF